MRKAIGTFAVAVGILLVAGSASAELVELSFSGSVTDWYAEYEGYAGHLIQTYYEQDVYDVTFDLLFDVDNYDESTALLFGIPWTHVFADGTFQSLDGTGGGASVYLTAADLAAYETSWNYGSGTYDSAAGFWVAAGNLSAGGMNTEYDDYSGHSEGVSGNLAAGGSSLDGVIYATGSLVEWCSDGVWEGRCLAMDKVEHGYCFNGVLTGYECVVPEPASITLLGLGLGGLAVARLRRRSR